MNSFNRKTWIELARHKLFLLLCFASVFLLPSQVLGAEVDGARIAVLYPDVPKPYLSVFTGIVDGIRSEYQGDIHELVLPKNFSLGQLQSWMDEKDLKAVIALGNQAMDLVIDLPEPYVSVTGAVLSVPESVTSGFSAITLAPDPALMFQELTQLAPEVKIVSVIYEPARHARLIARAKEAAIQQGIELRVYSESDAGQSGKLYRTFFKEKQAAEHAVWLLQGDQSLMNRSILYDVLKRAWYSEILVFSSNPSYVKKGVLFSLYPDNSLLGARLAKVMQKQLAGQGVGIEPAQQLLSALNIRTAEHLGLRVSRSKRREYDVVFPQN